MSSVKKRVRHSSRAVVPLAHEPEDFRAMLLAEIYRTWRDTADEDYIASRGAYRADLWGSFLWSGLQAVEKYLKLIVLLGGRSTKPFGHKLPELLDEARNAVPALAFIEPIDEQFISHLSIHGSNRYLTRQRATHRYDLYLLDRVTRRLRMYCDASAWTQTNTEPPLISRTLPTEPKQLWRAICTHNLTDGLLEKVLARKKTPAQRTMLVWRNAMYCSKPTRILRVPNQKWGWVNARVGLTTQQLQWLDERVRNT